MLQALSFRAELDAAGGEAEQLALIVERVGESDVAIAVWPRKDAPDFDHMAIKGVDRLLQIVETRQPEQARLLAVPVDDEDQARGLLALFEKPIRLQ